MSTIGSDYSAEFETASRKAKDGEKMREAKLERNLDNTLRKRDAESENTVRTVKDEYENSMQAMAKADRIDRERFKQSLYNKNGRQLTATEESARNDRDRALENAAAAQTQGAKALADSEKYQEQQSAATADRHQQEMENLAESYRKQIAEARSGESEDDHANTNEYRKKLAEETQSAIRQAREEVMAERRQAKILAEQTDFVMKERDRKADSFLNTRLREKDLAVKAELNKNAIAERQSRALEMQPLREQVMDTADMERDAARTKNEARAGAIRELETDWNSKYENQTQSHALETQKLKSENDDAERIYSEKIGRYMKESETKTAKKISEQNSEHRAQLTNAAREYDHSVNHVKLGAEHDKKLAGELLERERHLASDHQDRALAKQADTYQTTIANQRKNQQSQVQNLERILNNKNSTTDAGEISAGAEQTVRTAVTKQYDKTFQAEADRNARDRDHIDTAYRARLNDAIDDKQRNTTDLTRQNAKEQTVMRNEFVQHVTDVEENKRQMLNLASDANSKMTETNQRNTERNTNDMRRHYEDLIATRETDHTSKFEELRNQSEFEKRSMRRDYQAQTADLIRASEKKLTDQKVASDELNRDLKAKLDTKTRESDKRLMQALSDQGRGYDHRMVELEAQSKDRERLMAQQNEDELDKAKKANALLLSKKG